MREEQTEAERVMKEWLKEKEEKEKMARIQTDMPLMLSAVQYRNHHNHYSLQEGTPHFYFLDAESRLLKLPQEGDYPIPPPAKPHAQIRKKKVRKGAYWHKGPCVTKTGPVEAGEWEYISD